MKKLILLIFFLPHIAINSNAQEVIAKVKVLKTCFLYADTLESNKILKIKEGEEIDIIGMNGMFWNASYKDKIGYVSDKWMLDSKLTLYRLDIKEKKKKEEYERKQAEADKKDQEAKKIRLEYFTKIYGEQKAKKIVDGEVWIGMSNNEARASWGSPSEINRTETAYGVREQWVYESKDYKFKFLYFEDGKLETIQR